MTLRNVLLAGLVVLVGLAAPCADAHVAREWNFRALLDDKPIGTHHFSLDDGAGGDRTLVSEADFAVKFLGLTAYRYHHHATEQWRGDCLAGIAATTNDDGKVSDVHLGAEGLSGCVMSFAYWNPRIQGQTQLLNAQTGKIETVQVSRVGPGTLTVHGTPMPAVRWRITGAEHPIDVWYSTQGDWVGLDSTVDGGRKLSYRLQ
jgi:hypothetical protein